MVPSATGLSEKVQMQRCVILLVQIFFLKIASLRASAVIEICANQCSLDSYSSRTSTLKASSPGLCDSPNEGYTVS